jgi:hypothetical protein
MPHPNAAIVDASSAKKARFAQHWWRNSPLHNADPGLANDERNRDGRPSYVALRGGENGILAGFLSRGLDPYFGKHTQTAR